MRAVRIVLLTMLTAALLSATAYGAGYAVKHLEHETHDSADPGERSPLDGGQRDPGGAAGDEAPGPGTAEPRDERPPRGDRTPRRDRPAPPALTPGPTLLAQGDTGEPVRDLQARLKQIAWLSGTITGSYDATTVTAVRGFQAKREIPVTGEVDQRTLDRLHAMTREPSHEEKHNVAPPSGSTDAPLDPRCTSGRALCIDKSSRTLRWVVDGKVVTTLEVRFGASATPTREGTFSVRSKSPDHVSSLYGSAMPFAMFFSGGQAVHYSSDFAAQGYSGASHGCVNVRDYDGIAWLYDQVRVGDKVIVYWS